MHTPLFPIIIRACLVGIGYARGLALATVLLALASTAMFAVWAREAAPEIPSAIAVLAFLLLPARMFLYRSLGASEALMSLCVLAAAWAWRRGRADWAFFAAALATVTRTNGVLVVGVLCLLLLAERRFRTAVVGGAFAALPSSRSSRGTRFSTATSSRSCTSTLTARAVPGASRSRSRSSARWLRRTTGRRRRCSSRSTSSTSSAPHAYGCAATVSRPGSSPCTSSSSRCFASATSRATTSRSRRSRSSSRGGTSGRARVSRRPCSRFSGPLSVFYAWKTIPMNLASSEATAALLKFLAS
jgi:hypothetical protein